MNKTLAVICAAVLVIAFSEKCFSLEYTLENSDNVLSRQGGKSYESHDSSASSEEHLKHEGKREIHPIFDKLFRSNDDKREEALDETDRAINKRVVRQAYQGQTSVYPHLPSGPPYGLEPFPNSNNQQRQPPYNNNIQSGYPFQPNGNQPNYNNPYGTNTQLPQNNYTQQAYPNYKPSNFSYINPSGPYGQNPPSNPWQPQNPPNNAQGPYNPSNGNYPPYNTPGFKPVNPYNNPSSRPPYSQPGQFQNNSYPGYPSQTPGQGPYNPSNGNYPPYNNPGFKPANPYNNASSRPPYSQPGQFQNNSYPGYPSQTPGYNRPTNTPSPYPYNQNQRPSYYPGQGQVNNTRYPQVVPGNQHPVVYDNSFQKPGQNPYGSYNVSNWSGTSLNNTQGRPAYNWPNSNTGSPGYGSQTYNNPYNVPTQRPPYQDSTFGQYQPNGYQGNSPGYPNAYNPSIPYGPPYGNTPPHGSGPNANDPTKVSPQHFNSF